MDACHHLINDGWSEEDALIACRAAAVDWRSWLDSEGDCGGGLAGEQLWAAESDGVGQERGRVQGADRVLAVLTQRLHPDEFADADIGHTQSADGEAEVGSTRLDSEALGSEAEAPRPQESPSAVEQHAQPCEEDCAPDAGSTDFAKLPQNVDSEAEGHTAGARTGKRKKKCIGRARRRPKPQRLHATPTKQ